MLKNHFGVAWKVYTYIYAKHAKIAILINKTSSLLFKLFCWMIRPPSIEISLDREIFTWNVYRYDYN